MSDFEQERDAVINAIQDRRRTEIDARLVKAGLGYLYNGIDDVVPQAPDSFSLTISDDFCIALSELKALSVEFNTAAVKVQRDADLTLEIWLEGIL